jgi:hypothetical protein
MRGRIVMRRGVRGIGLIARLILRRRRVGGRVLRGGIGRRRLLGRE